MIKPRINRSSKILSISHNDLDGTVCQIILGNVFKNITFLNRSFYNIDKTLEDVNYSEYDFVFVTDIYPENESLLDKSNNIILIDHHKTSINEPEKFRYSFSKKCASVYVKRFVEALFNIKLDHLKSLVYITNDYDLYKLNNFKSIWMNEIMMAYKPDKFRRKFFNGRTRFTMDEMLYLKTRRNKFNDIWDNLDVFELDEFNGCITIESDFMNEVANKLMKDEGYKIIFNKHPNSGRLSIRHCIEDFNAGQYLKDLGWGGGHKYAAGMFLESEETLKNVIQTIEEHLIKNFKEN